MSLIEKVRQQRLEARADKARAVELSILTLLVGELETATKGTGAEITDEKVIGAVRKLIKSNEQTIQLASQNDATKDTSKFVQENAVLSTFLPVVWSEDTLLAHIKESGAKDMGGIMRHLKQFAGQYEPAMASKVAKAYLGS